ncbi:ribonuclease Z [Staphylococcus pseudintermedius]|uniref:ribonuclease Z n=1 Tax=Staphylococcus pseudintermedius TaxID=283734 RepID=UPI0019F53AEB|nr:ribonuclease Z [Staphylococcus pseudintermedius]EGQ3176298.1 ribonuclease Z [Staphylococcus pseudintermedius]EHT7652700.1 ribonuclease Z [Staphylococcus pseudintermedius]EIQ4013277.1 ribonuclease Z [Staphylococcus pseudintermedius]MBU7227142.1 ribonuclease Z [Staphylococcus pseudintermedius]MDK4150299.1 ribonuclease Z [Staphylococcus pseudintermedius]
MEITFFGTSAGLPTKERHTQSIALKLEPYATDVWLFDVGEATQHQILHHSIKLGKVSHIFITHMHGDHVFGLPGVLTSRSFQGGESKPLTVIGPKGIKDYVECNLSLTYSHLNYPLHIIEIEDQMNLSINGFEINARPLNHGIPCFGYRIQAPDTPGKLDVQKLQALGMPPGPQYQKVKSQDTFEFEGQIYDANDFKGPDKKGQVVTIFGDTRPSQYALELAKDADVLVHESTYIEGDKTLANAYHHSHIEDVLALIEKASVKHGLLTHISSRYMKEDINEIETKLKAHSPLSFQFVEDFDSYQF